MTNKKVLFPLLVLLIISLFGITVFAAPQKTITVDKAISLVKNRAIAAGEKVTPKCQMGDKAVSISHENPKLDTIIGGVKYYAILCYVTDIDIPGFSYLIFYVNSKTGDIYYPNHKINKKINSDNASFKKLIIQERTSLDTGY